MRSRDGGLDGYEQNALRYEIGSLVRTSLKEERAKCAEVCLVVLPDLARLLRMAKQERRAYQLTSDTLNYFRAGGNRPVSSQASRRGRFRNRIVGNGSLLHGRSETLRASHALDASKTSAVHSDASELCVASARTSDSCRGAGSAWP